MQTKIEIISHGKLSITLVIAKNVIISLDVLDNDICICTNHYQPVNFIDPSN